MEEGAGDSARRPGVVAGAQHDARDLGFFGALLPAMEGAVLGVCVHPDVVAVSNPQLLGIVRIDVHVAFTHPGRSLVVAVHIAVGAPPDRQDVEIRNQRVNTVTILWRDPLVGESVFHQRMLRLHELVGCQHDVAHLARLTTAILAGESHILWCIGPDHGVRCRNDRIGLVEGGVNRFTVKGDILTVHSKLGLIAEKFETARAVVPGKALYALFVANELRIASPHHHDGDALLSFLQQVLESIALGDVAVIQNPLDVGSGLVFLDEFPIVVETLISGDLCQLARHAGVGLSVRSRVVNAINLGEGHHLHERIRAGVRHIVDVVLTPGVHGQYDVRVLAAPRPPPLVHDHRIDHPLALGF